MGQGGWSWLMHGGGVIDFGRLFFDVRCWLVGWCVGKLDGGWSVV